jgi:hypothetical protein
VGAGDPVARDKAVRKSRVRVWRPEGGEEKEELPLQREPLPPGWDFEFNPVVRVLGVAPAAPAQMGSPGELGNEASGQAAGEEKAKEPEARKEGGQSAAAEAQTAVAPVDSESEDDSWVPAADPVSLGGGEAEPAGAAAAVCPQGSEGGMVRLPVRPPGESGDTPEPNLKAAKLNEQEGAAALEAAGARLAPVRLAWGIVAGRNQRGIRVGVRVGVGRSKHTRHYATK